MSSGFALSLEALSDMPCKFVLEHARPSLRQLHSKISEHSTLIWTPDAPFAFWPGSAPPSGVPAMAFRKCCKKRLLRHSHDITDLNFAKLA